MVRTYRDKRIESARVADPDCLVSGMSMLLADIRFPHFVRPICEAARRQGIPVVLDADRPTVEDDPLFLIPTHVVFSSECLRATTGQDDLAAGLMRMTAHSNAFLAGSDGAGAGRYVAGGAVPRRPGVQVDAVA